MSVGNNNVMKEHLAFALNIKSNELSIDKVSAIKWDCVATFEITNSTNICVWVYFVFSLLVIELVSGACPSIYLRNQLVHIFMMQEWLNTSFTTASCFFILPWYHKMDMLGANLTINLRPDVDTLGLLGHVQWYLSLVTAFHVNSIWTSFNGTHSSLITHHA
jgi:hypothetical protein